MNRLSSIPSNGHGPGHDTARGKSDATVLISTTANRTARPPEPERQPVLIVALLTDAEAMDQVRQGRVIEALDPKDPRIALVQSRQELRRRAPTETAVPISNGRESETARVADPSGSPPAVGKAPRKPIDQLTDKPQESAFVQRLRLDIDPVLSRRARDFVHYCIENTRTPLSGTQAAQCCGLGIAELTKTLEGIGYPPIDDIILWCRVLRASWFLGQMPGRSGERIARALQFKNGQALRLAVQRLTRRSVPSLRTDAAYNILFPEFRERMCEVISMQVGEPTPPPPSSR